MADTMPSSSEEAGNVDSDAIHVRLRLVGAALAIAGLILLALGLLMLFVWEISLFRATTFERDFAGLPCGVPLDNPGWRTGSPCHGAVNRQTGAAWVTTLAGLGCVMAAVTLAVPAGRPVSTTLPAIPECRPGADGGRP